MKIKLKYTKSQIAWEIISVLILISSYVYLFIRWRDIPDMIPGHYNIAGEIDRWGKKTELIALPIISTLLYALLTVTTHIPSIWNMPFETTDANRDRVYGSMKSMILVMKAEIMAIFFYLNYNGIEARSLHPLFSIIAYPGVLVTLFIWLVVITKKYK